MDAVGFEKVHKKLNNVIKKINGAGKKILPHLAHMGKQNIIAIAPEATGALKAAVIHFKKSDELWVIKSKQPQKSFYNEPFISDKKTEPVPYHVYIEKGTQPAKTGRNAYMRLTADMLRKKAKKKMIEVTNDIVKG